MKRKLAVIGLAALLLSVVLIDVYSYEGYYGRTQTHQLPQTPIVSQANGTATTPEKIKVELFTTNNCTPCDNERAFLQDLLPQYSCCMALEEYNLVQNESSRSIFTNLSKKLGFSASHVPVLVVGDNYNVGFESDETSGNNIQLIIDQTYKRYPRELLPSNNTGEPSNVTERVDITVFWREGCPHCAAEKADFLPHITSKYQGISVHLYDVDSGEGLEKLREVSQAMGFSASSVPVTIISNGYYQNHNIGFGTMDSTGKLLESMVQEALAAIPGPESQGPTGSTEQNVADVPLIGKVDLNDVSLPLFTIVIGLVDGFNPCAFFVLFFLLTLLVYAKSRAKMLAIGLTFVFISGFVYFLFMAAWLTFFEISGSIGIVTIIGGLIAIVLGIINFKEFFFLGQGDVSTTISDKHKKDLFSRMRGLIKSSTMFEMLIGTIVLAVVANTYELLCTVGLPMIYTKALSMHNLGDVGYYLYLLLYNIFYVLPLLVIVIAFAWTLGAKKMSKDLGEMLKLISGLMMLRFGLTLMIAPDLMMDIGYTMILVFSSIIVGVLGWKLKMIILHEGKNNQKVEGKKSASKEDKQPKKENEDGTSKGTEI